MRINYCVDGNFIYQPEFELATFNNQFIKK